MTVQELLDRYARGERDFRGANLARAYLDRANLGGACLAGADLAGANLARANLADANLAGADLADANLARANLGGACLADADLAGAYLAGANLARAYLDRANLDRACLARAKWFQTRLHASGAWDAYPPRASAGDWHAIVVAPGIVRIRCRELTCAQWVGEEGATLAHENDVSADDVETLRAWLIRMAARTEWPGWTPEK